MFRYRCNRENLGEKIKSFSDFGKVSPASDNCKGGVITRLSLSPAAVEARKEIIKRCEKIGCEVVFDDIGNIYATLPGSENLPAVISGSHADSVVRGGNFDGILGVLGALEAIETIKRENIPHKRPITLVIWTNEEGANFPPAMFSSGIISGKFDKETLMKSKASQDDSYGATFEEALKNSGFNGDETNRFTAEKYFALLELHIEQGPVLESEEKEIGILEGVVGMVNYHITLEGLTGHAGTVPMGYRKDALYAASKVIIMLHEELDKIDTDGTIVYTTGHIEAFPNVHTNIPEKVTFSLDIRHKSPEVIANAVKVIENLPSEIEKCKLSYTPQWTRKTTPFDSVVVGINEDNTKALGYSYKRMYSGPGHDAQFIADMVPSAMIFVPSIAGHSHSELEYTPTESCAKGVDVLLNSIIELSNK
ncbi:MAG: Zn-dependent hydrolase [Ruminococcus sp.]|jgi:N-carbamoyl-L-amino-acid hydrolase|nr:Zn-dependent hydrolase [Ruminococcus sp.]